MNKGTTETKTCTAMNSNRMRQPNHRGSIRKRGNKYEASVFINGTRYYFTTDTLEQAHTIVFDSVSRMSRNATEGFELYQQLFQSGVDLVFLKEPLINTQTYKDALKTGIPLTGTSVDLILSGVNAYLMELAKNQIRLAFQEAQKEVDELHQRTKEGIATARLHGKQIGCKAGAKLLVKKAGPAKEIIRRHSVTFGGSLKDSECAKLAGISRNTFYKYKRELLIEAQLETSYQ